MFFCEFRKVSKNTFFLQNSSGRLILTFMIFRKFCVWINDTQMDIICFLLKSVQEFIEIQRWLILTSFMFPQLSSTHISYISYKTKKCRYVNKIFYKMDRKWMVAPFHQPLRQNLRWLFENSFYSQEKEHAFFWKTVLRIFEIALCLKKIGMILCDNH